MNRQMEKTAWVLVGAAMTLGIGFTGGAAIGQQAGGPPPGAGSMVRGTIAQKNVDNNAVLVNTGQGQQWVQLPQDVTISKQVEAKIADIKVKDVITISGTPTAIEAGSIQMTDAQAGQAAGGAVGAGAAPGGPGGFGGPGGRRNGASAMVTGTVDSLDPLIIVSGTTKITVTAKEGTKVTRQTQVGVKDLSLGEQFMAAGQADNRNVIQARFASVGQTDGMFGGFGGGPGVFGGPGGGPGGGPAGGFGGGAGGRFRGGPGAPPNAGPQQ